MSAPSLPKSEQAPAARCVWLLCGLAVLGSCGDADPHVYRADCCAVQSLQQAPHTACGDANMQRAVGEALNAMIGAGQLKGRGIWQQGQVRRRGHTAPVALFDDAHAGVIDGYQYQAYLTAAPPHLAHTNDDCAYAEPAPACAHIDAHTHVTLERTGGIAGSTWRTDTLMAYRQSDQIHLCACPSSALTERLPLCCSLLCCH